MNGDTDSTAGPAEINPVSLSQALLAPLDAIFKAQIHAARSFINFLLQLGYPDEYSDFTEDDIVRSLFIERLRGDHPINGRLLDALQLSTDRIGEVSVQQIVDVLNDLLDSTDLVNIELTGIYLPQKINNLIARMRTTTEGMEPLTDTQIRQVNKFILSNHFSKGIKNVSSGYIQKFPFTTQGEDGTNLVSEVHIPTLSLVPVAPLAVESAEFTLTMHVESTNEKEHKQMRDSVAQSGDVHKRPWFIIDKPIDIKGKLAPTQKNEMDSSDKTSMIDIQIKVGRIPMPAGLDRLLTALNQSCTVSSE